VGNGREVELKLQIAAGDLARLKKNSTLRALADGRTVSKRLHSVYFDTPGLELWRSRVTLRLRGLGRQRVQTVKLADGEAAGALDRIEWEREVSGDRPDLAGLPQPAADRLLADAELPDRLGPRLETEIRRSLLTIRPPDGGEIELAFDVGEVRGDGVALPISEAELELKQGRKAQLFDLARALAELAPVRVEVRSKAERGFAALAGEANASAGSRPLRLESAASVEEAFRTIAEACLAHLLANQAAALDGGAAGGVHQMRVALRRLRAALGLFRIYVDSPESLAIRQDLKRLADALGPARDADVFLAEALAPALAEHPGDERLLEFRDAAEGLRQARYREMDAALRAPSYTDLILRLGAWAADARWRRPADALQERALARPILELAPELLEERRRKVKRLGARLDTLDADERHALRIHCKKLRYAGEFLQGLYPDSSAAAYLKGLAALQDRLGVLNDAVVARQLAEEIAAAEPDEARRARLLWAGGFVAGWSDRTARRRWRKVGEQWREWRRLPKFWR
jgi:inorganic triphosphatase YgiF